MADLFFRAKQAVDRCDGWLKKGARGDKQAARQGERIWSDS